MDFDANSLYPTTLSDDETVYPKSGSGYALTKYTKSEFLNVFNDENFFEGSAVLKIKYYNPENKLHQLLKKLEKK